MESGMIKSQYFPKKLLKPSTLFHFFATFLILLASVSAFSIQPSAQQLAQLKNMSPAEQASLAQQFGVSIPSPGQQTLAPVVVQSDTVMVREAVPEPEVKTNAEVLGKGLKSFGYDLFAGNPTSFTPVNDIPVSSDYILGAGDSLKVNLYGKESQFFELLIDQEGQAQLSNLGPISLAGLSFSEAKKKIVATINQKMIGVSASVSMGQLRSIRVFVLGEAFMPGSYVISPLSTITNALVLSGGVSELGSLRNVQLKRKGKLIGSLDLYDLLLKGDTSNDAQLQSGDVVFIPPVGSTVGIKGEVRRPAFYELKEREPVSNLVNYAGGLLSSAYPELASLQRINQQGERTILNVDLRNSQQPVVMLQDGDILNLPRILEKIENVVQISGHIERPETLNWQKNLRISAVVPSVSFLKAKPDLQYALIKRYSKPNQTLSVLSFSLADALAGAGTNKDPLLQDQDEVVFFGLLEDSRNDEVEQIVEELRAQANLLESSKEVSVLGDVRYPGVYPLVEGMQVGSLIYAAGGLTEKAFQLYAELNRSEFSISQEHTQSRKTLDLSNKASLREDLKSRDVLQIKTIPNWAERKSVVIGGEVRFPGTYSIDKTDTLATVIERAGGLTGYAYAPGAMFTRVTLKAQQAQQLVEMQERLESDIAKVKLVASNQSTSGGKSSDLDEAQKLLERLKTTPATGRLVIDLDKVINKTEEYVISLENGDNLLIPRKKNSVTIVGEVQWPISQVYENELSYLDYIFRSGGLTNKADEDRIYIIKANGGVHIPEPSNWFASNHQTLEPGDTIVVPLDAEKIDEVILWRDMSQIFYQIALGVVAVGSL
jgi:protein involved in polysaccharide export with SLBB domain